MEIRDQPTSSGPLGKSLSSISPVAPFDGLVQVVFFNNFRRFGSELTSSDSLRVLVNGSLAASEPLIDRYVPADTTMSNCVVGQPNGPYYFYNSPDSLSTWDAVQVTAGEVIDFQLVAGTAVGTPVYSQVSTNIWSVSVQEPCQTSTWLYRLDFGLIIVRDTLELHIDEPKTLWPDIDSFGINKGAPTGFDFSQVRDSIGITITSEDTGAPVEGLDVTVTAEWVDGSGGHSHTSPQFPSGWLKFRDLANPEAVESDQISVTTDANGEAHLRVYAPPWGGRLRISANATYNTVSLLAVDSLEVRVPNLIRLGEDPNLGSIVLVGGTCDHHGKFDLNWIIDV